MGLLSKVGNFLGEATGFGGGGKIDTHATDPAAYKELYEQALAGINNVGTDPNSKAMRGGIESTALAQLANLDNNAAGRKKTFGEDMSRSFSADTQNLARSKGGTGSLATATRNAGSMYDAQARETARGYNDLYSQATQDLGSLQGVQGNLYNQDFDKANAAAGLSMNELNSRRGTLNQNNENQYNADQVRRDRQMNTVGSLAKGAGISGILGGK